MRKASVVLGIMLLAGSCFEAQELSNQDELFMKGYAAGQAETYESQIITAHLGLRLLKDIDETKAYRRMLITSMNSALFSLWHVADEVTIRPEILKSLASIKSTNFKEFFDKLKKLRNQNNWSMAKQEQENKVQWVLDQYIEYGNIYGFHDL